jgi:tRNA1Val (adenine37-N6)-methyltransferase
VPNTYFQFKQFTVHQERGSLKVCTDACLFGAWVADKLKAGLPPAAQILDIGTGTGLLSLMLAQELTAAVDAIEIDTDAYTQATDNFCTSPWPEKLTVHHIDARQFEPGHQYDLVIANPPFYENDLRSVDEQKNKAKHETTLDLLTLTGLSARWLKPGGYFALLLPAHREKKALEACAVSGMHPRNIIKVRQTERHSPFRVMMIFSTGSEKPEVDVEEITIKETNVYTPAFVSLLKPFYLHL